jgi:hypothetical protein
VIWREFLTHFMIISPQRSVAHLDIDTFFVSVERLKNAGDYYTNPASCFHLNPASRYHGYPASHYRSNPATFSTTKKGGAYKSYFPAVF